MLTRLTWDAGYDWGVALSEMEVSRRIIPLPQPEYRRLYENAVSKLKASEARTAGCRASDKLYQALMMGRGDDGGAAADDDDDDGDGGGGGDGDGDGGASVLSMGSASERGVHPEDVRAYVATVPFNVVKLLPATYIDHASDGSMKKKQHFTFSETVLVDELVKVLNLLSIEYTHAHTYSDIFFSLSLFTAVLCSLSHPPRLSPPQALQGFRELTPFERDLFAHVSPSGEGLAVQYRVRARSRVGWSAPVFTAMKPLDDRLNRILRLDPHFDSGADGHDHKQGMQSTMQSFGEDFDNDSLTASIGAESRCAHMHTLTRTHIYKHTHAYTLAHTHTHTAASLVPPPSAAAATGRVGRSPAKINLRWSDQRRGGPSPVPRWRMPWVAHWSARWRPRMDHQS